MPLLTEDQALGHTMTLSSDDPIDPNRRSLMVDELTDYYAEQESRNAPIFPNYERKEQQAKRNHYRDAFSSVEKMDELAGPNGFASINEYSPDAEAEKRKSAILAYMAETTEGATAEGIAPHYDTYKNDWATQIFQRPISNIEDKELYSMIGDKFRKEDDAMEFSKQGRLSAHDTALKAISGDHVEGALPDFIKTFPEDMETSVKDDLTREWQIAYDKRIEAGKKYAGKVVPIIEAFRVLTENDTATKDFLWDIKIKSFKPDQAGKSASKKAAQEVLREAFIGLKDDPDLQEIMSVVAEVARQDVDGFSEQLEKSFGRGVSGMIDTISSGATKRDAIYFRSDGVLVPKSFNATDTDSAREQMLDMGAFGKTPIKLLKRDPTPKERALLKTLSEEIDVENAAIRDIRTMLESRIDPIESGNVVEKGLYDFMALIPQVAIGAAAMAATKGGVVPSLAVGTAVQFPIIASQRSDEFLNTGKYTTEQAVALGDISASWEAPMESLGNLFLIGKIPFLNKIATKWSRKMGVMGFIKKEGVLLGGRIAAENLTEAAQDITPMVVADVMGALAQDYPDADWSGLDRYIEGRSDVFWAMLPLNMLGIGGSKMNIDMRKEVARQYGSSVEAIRLYSGTTEAIGMTIANEPNLLVRAQMLEDLEVDHAKAEKYAVELTKLTVGQEIQGPRVTEADGTFTVEFPDGTGTVTTESAAIASKVSDDWTKAWVEKGEKLAEVEAEKALEEPKPDANAKKPEAVPEVIPDPESPGPNLGPGASSAREWRTRNFHRRFTEDESLDPDILDEIGGPDAPGGKYVPITNKDTVASAGKKIDQNGLIQTAEKMLETTVPDGDFATHIMTAQLVLKKMNVATKVARDAKNIEDTARLAELAAEVATTVASIGTKLGQGIQAFAVFSRLTPEGTILAFEKQRKDAADAAGIPNVPLTGAQKAKINELAERMDAAEEGHLKNFMAVELEAEKARIQGVSIMDLVTSYWYANILSGMGTQIVNVSSTAFNLGLKSAAVLAVSHPQNSIAYMKGMMKGVRLGLIDAKAAMEGKQVIRTSDKWQSPGALDTVKMSKWKPKTWLAAGKYVFRSLNSMDSLFFRTASEGRAHLAASRIARQDSKATGKKYADLLANELYGLDPKMDKAMAQAEIDVQILKKPTKSDVKRRAFEIIEQGRRPEITAESKRFGSIVTYTNKPEGVLGGVAELANLMVSKIALDLSEVRIRGRRVGKIEPVRGFVPFINIVANVVNEQLNYTPIGLIRAYKGSPIVNKGQSAVQYSREERIEKAAGAIMGTAVIAGFAQIASALIDDEDPFFAIYGDGPPNWDKVKQRRATGWMPFSVKVGDNYFSYKETPLNIPLAVIGGMHDAERWSTAYNRKGQIERFSYATRMAAKAISSASFLRGAEGLMDVATGKSDALPKYANTAKGLIPASSLLRDLSKMSDANIVDYKEGAWAAFVSGIPYVQNVGTHDSLNAFGEPIEYSAVNRIPGAGRFYSRRVADPVWTFMAENDLTIPNLPQTQDFAAASLSRAQKGRLETIKEARKETIGRYAYDLLTYGEVYELQQESGKQIKEYVETLMQKDYDNETMQALIKKQTTKIRRRVKIEILGINEK